ncbi:hypothetical protein BU25DRAFT_69875 [Macroventuria anomochaeta]|uniref:Uncharacterized protein n=1 Tax=Macroventuria anomochaeta TaxID=301207 RepID=A0ACB6S169_9PLEO|nr:uncharacterized protein BU25DRAFT_69875 [Macroventuria anomochaeta]KAF2627134.1 hypothetical protein BU25DRAFT_69875 [Macroventuria anomochaeta]
MMGDADPSELPTQPPMAINTSTKPAAWRLANSTRSTIQSRPDSQHLEHHNEPSPGWSAVQHDFERRLSRFGIKVSEDNNNPASNTSNKPIAQSRAAAHAIMDRYNLDTAPRDIVALISRTEEFPPLEAPTMACFSKNKKETKVETLERQLRQAQTEAQIWKEKSETQECELRVSYGETMEWRMKYEDLYSAIIQARELQPRDLRVKREGTKSLG